MPHNSANASKEIVWVGNNPNNSSDIHNIKKIVYCDNLGYTHLVWPCRAELTNVYIVDLTDNTSYAYTYDSNSGLPSPRILPHHNYAVKGTIVVYSSPGVIQTTLTDCYFFHETFGNDNNDNDPPSLNWTSPDNSTAGYPDVYPKDNGTAMSSSHGYNVYRLDDETVGDIKGRSLQLGFYNDDSYGFYTQNGFVFDTNYQTPIILKRITLSEECGVFDTSNNQQSASSISFGGNNSITLVPKVRTYNSNSNYSSNWDIPSSWTIRNTTNWCTIVDNQDGSYTFTANNSTPNTNVIEFESPNGTVLSLYFVYAGTAYRAKIGSDLASSTLSLNGTESVTLQETTVANPQESDWVASNETFTITSTNTNVISVNNTNHTISSVSPGSSTVEVLVNGSVIRTVTITVNQSSLYMHVVKDGQTYVTTNPVNLGTGNSVQGPYNLSLALNNTITFEFYSDSNGSSSVSGISTDSTDSDYSVPSGMIVSPSGNTITLVPQTHTGNYKIPVFWSSNKLGYVYGEITN